MCKTVEFISTKLETQCNKCQKFKHTTNSCNGKLKRQFCVKTHNTHDHKYDVYKSNQIYSHIDLNFANCNKKYYAKIVSCEVYFALKSNARNIDKLHV